MAKKNSFRKIKEGWKNMSKLKKALVIIAVIAVVVLIAYGIDDSIRNPVCEDETAALILIHNEIVPGLNEIPDDSELNLTVEEGRKIEGTVYYQVTLRVLADENDKEGTVYDTYDVRRKDSKVFVMRDGKLIKFA